MYFKRFGQSGPFYCGLGFVLLLVLSLFFDARGALAEVSGWFEIPNGRARLLATEASDAIAQTDTAFGIEVLLDEGWKIYWVYAGPVGQPTQFRAQNLPDGQDVAVFFPWPKRDTLQGFPSYGYADRVIFPGLLEGVFGGGEMEVYLSICSQTQCIPHRLTLEMPLGPVGQDALVLNKLRQALKSIPVPVPGKPTLQIDRQSQSLTLGNVGFAPLDDFLLSADGAAARKGFFLWNPREVEGGGLSADYDIRDNEADLSFLETAEIYARGPAGAVVFSLRQRPMFQKLADVLGIEFDALASEETSASSPSSTDIPPWQSTAKGPLLGDGVNGPGAPLISRSIFGAAVFLFFGGLLLNLMPCVLPVLFLKMRALMTSDQEDRARSLRHSFGWTAVGIIGTFILIGLGLSIAQGLSGLQLTLGAWLQFPITAVVLSVLVTLFTANAFGWFEFVVPASIVSLGANRQGIVGDILAGMVAALLGGACAGILMAVALSVAFAQPPLMMTMLLAIMGVGLALPYVLVALIPGAARLIPKPSPWASWLKPVMGVGLLATLVYLLLILGRQLLPGAVIGVGGVSLITLFVLWMAARRRNSIVRYLSLAVLGLMVPLAPLFSLPPDPVESARDYDAEIKAMVAQGDRVFVDITAFWCATCQTNKLLVLEAAEIRELFEKTGTQLFVINADMLAENITTFMADQGRNSLPLNILFSPKYPNGEILPSVLTKNAVQQAVNRTL